MKYVLVVLEHQDVVRFNGGLCDGNEKIKELTDYLHIVIYPFDVTLSVVAKSLEVTT